MNVSNKNFFENVYKESIIKRLDEISVTTFANMIKRAIAKNTVVESGHNFGKKFAKNPFNETIQCRTIVDENCYSESFNRVDSKFNTKLIETLFSDLESEVNNTNCVKQYLEAFIQEIKQAGVSFIPSSIINVA